MNANNPRRWSPLDGYGEGEGKQHPMLSGTEKLEVNYDYTGPDSVLINRNFMPITADVATYFAKNPKLIKGIRMQSYASGILYFTMKTPLLYALFYSILEIPPEINTLIVCEGYERMLALARAKHLREENKEIAKALAELDVEMEALYKELNTKIADPAFDLNKRTEKMENAIVELLYPFTVTYLAILERCCWRLYAKFTKREHAFRPSTVPLAAAPASDQSENSYSICELMRRKWKACFGEEIVLEDTLKLDEKSVLESRYHIGVNVLHALFLFDYYRQESSVELIEKK